MADQNLGLEALRTIMQAFGNVNYKGGTGGQSIMGGQPFQMNSVQQSMATIGIEEGEKVLRKKAKTDAEQVVATQGVQALAGLVEQSKSMLSSKQTAETGATTAQPQTQPQVGISGQQTTNPSFNIQTPQNILQTLFQQRGIATDAQGNITVKSPGIFNVTPSSEREVSILSGLQELAGQKPLQKGEKERFGMEQKGALERLSTEYGYKAQIEAYKAGIDPNNPTIATTLFQNDLVNMIDAFENISMKGNKLAGAAGAIGAAAGFDREARAKYKTLAESFGYSYGAYVWKQQGRSLDAKENALLKQITTLKTTDTRGQVIGKIQALIDASNSRAKQAGFPELPNAKTLLSQIKQNKQSIATQKMGRDVSNIQSELDSINIRLREFGE